MIVYKQILQAIYKENIKIPYYWALCEGKLNQWITLTKGQ